MGWIARRRGQEIAERGGLIPSEHLSPLPPKPPSASVTDTVQLVMPSDANPLGTIFGGQVMAWIDAVAAMAAQRHCRQVMVTLSMDALEFKAPILVGEYAVLRAVVNRAWTTSVEVEVSVDAEHPITGERRHSAEAFLTFVALGANGRPTAVPPVDPQTPEEHARFAAAEVRRAARLAARQAAKPPSI